MANKKRLIDANVLSDKVDESKHSNPHQQGMVRVNHRNEHDHFLRMICEAPTVDAVEVVRCKDCKCGKHPESTRLVGKYMNCALYDPMPLMRCNDFCSYGERRTDG